MRKLVINRSLLSDCLDLGGVFAGRSKTLSTLDNVKIVFRGGCLYISSFDSENASVRRCDCISESGFGDGDGFLINPKDLQSVLRSFSDDDVTLSVDDKKCSIKHSRGIMSLPVLPLDDYPQVPKDGFRFRSTLPTSVLGAWVSKARLFHSTDILYGVLQGFCLSFENEVVSFGVTDKYKLFYDTYSNVQPIGLEGKVDVVVHNKVFNALLSLLSLGDSVDITVGDSCVTFAVADAKFHCRLVEGSYPNINRIIPKNSTIDIEIEKSDLMDSVKRSLIASNATSRQLFFTLKDDKLMITANNVDFGKSSEEECPCNVLNGGEITFSLKGDSVVSCLSAVDSDVAIMHLTSFDRPVLISDKSNNDVTIMVMPMLI